MKRFLYFCFLFLCLVSCGEDYSNIILDSPPILALSHFNFINVASEGAELKTTVENYDYCRIGVTSVYYLFDNDIDLDNIYSYRRHYFGEPVVQSSLMIDVKHKYTKCTLSHENDSTYSTNYLTIVNLPDNDREFRIIVPENDTNETRLFLIILNPLTPKQLGATVFICQKGLDQ